MNGTQEVLGSKQMQSLRESAATGLDLSPGDPTSAWAVQVISQLLTERDALKAKTIAPVDQSQKTTTGTIPASIDGLQLRAPYEATRLVQQRVGERMQRVNDLLSGSGDRQGDEGEYRGG